MFYLMLIIFNIWLVHAAFFFQSSSHEDLPVGTSLPLNIPASYHQ